MIERLKSRRFWLVAFAFVTFTALIMLAKIDQGTYERLTIAILGAFLTSSYFEKRLTKNDAPS